MARADNSANLIPSNRRSEEERRRIGRMGGIASGEARRKKRSTKQAAKFVLGLEPDLPSNRRKALEKMGLSPDEIPDIRLISVLAIAQKAMKGDLQASKMLMEMAGDIDAKLQLERDKLKLERERLEYDKQRTGQPDSESLPQIIIQCDGEEGAQDA